MPFFESIIRELNEKFGLGGQAGALVMTFLRTIIGDKGGTGNLSDFLGCFKSAGLGDLVSSWIGQGENRPIAPAQFETAVGSDFISRIASKVGLSSSAVTPALAFLAPKVINALTPNGQVPTSLPPDVSAFLAGGAPLAADSTARSRATGGATYAGAGATATRATAQSSGGGLFRKLVPLLGLLLLGLLAYWFFGRGDDQTAQRAPAPSATETQAPATAASASPQVTVTPSQLALRNADGQILYSGTMPDAQTRTSIVDSLKGIFGASGIAGDLNIDPSAAAPDWLGKLSAALGEFKIPGADMLLKGESIGIGGALSEAQKSGLITQLKSIFGEGFSVGALTESLAGTFAAITAPEPSSPAMPTAANGAADANATALRDNETSLAALKDLPAGYSAEDLVEVLNTSVINFETGSAVIPPDSDAFLRNAAVAIAAAPTGSMIEIGGHTDATGDSDQNMGLSQARAEAVRSSLVAYGVAPMTLTARGYGGSQPVASNETAEGRDQNRRIAFTVTP